MKLEEEMTNHNVPVAAVALMVLAVLVLIVKGCWDVTERHRSDRALDGQIAMVSDPSPE